MPNELVTVPRTMAARVTRAVERIRKRQKPYGRKYLRRDRTGMKILFSPGTNPGFPTAPLHPRSRVRLSLRKAACSSPIRQSPTGNPGEATHTSIDAACRSDAQGFQAEWGPREASNFRQTV